MKVVERGRIFVTQVGEGAVIPLMMIPFCLALGISPWVYVGLFVLALVFGYLKIRISGVFIGLGLSVALFSCITLIIEAFSLNFEINGSLLTGACLIIGSGLVYGTRRLNLDPHQTSDVLVWGATSILLSWMTWAVHSWTPTGAFNILALTDDRYSPWLAALAHSVQDGGVALSEASNGNGGPASNVVLITGRVLHHWFLQTSEIVRTDNALVLLQISIAVVLLISATWILISRLFTKTKSALVQCAYGLSISLLTYSIGIGFVRVGHFAALCGTFFISLALLAHLTLENASVKWPYLRASIVLMLLTAAGMAWLPLALLAILYACFAVAGFMSEKGIVSGVKSISDAVKTILFSMSLVVAVCAFLWKSSILEGDKYLTLRTQSDVLPGGKAAIQPFLLMLGIAVVIWFAVKEGKHRNDSDRVFLFSALLVPLVGLLLKSYFVAPFMPQVKDWMFVYVCAAVFLPLSVLVFVSSIDIKIANMKSEILLGPAFVILLLALLSPTSTNMNWVSNLSNTETEWTKTVVAELIKNPEQAVACLNTTRGDVAGDKDAYECTRMAFALGGFDANAYKLWENSTGCLIEPGNVIGQFSSQFQSTLTVLLSDAFRTSSSAGCQSQSDMYRNGWLTDVDWRNIRTMSRSGIPVTVFPTSPGQ